MKITQELVQKLFICDEETGYVFNRVARGKSLAGTRAGTINVQGYRQIQIGGYIFREHRIIWLYFKGYLPEELDHKDGIRDHNALSNLRETDRSQNNANSERTPGTSGLRGVTWFERDLKWKAQIRVSGRTVHLGYFDTAEEANKVYLVAADRVHGEYAYHNRETSETVKRSA